MAEETRKELARDLLRVLNGMRNTEDARVTAILPASFIEVHLAALIKKNLPGIDEHYGKKLFGLNGWLTEMARKIDLSVCLGLVKPSLAKRFELVARVRNRFAHELQVTSFDHQRVVPLIDSLTATNTPPPKIMVGHEWEPLLAKTKAGLFTREAMSACGALSALMSGGEWFEYTDESVPEGTPRTLRKISFGTLPQVTEDPHPKGR